MTYTQNYHLPQWVEDDRILRTDFNQMCANIDAALSNAAQGSEHNWSGLLRLAQQNLGASWPRFDQNNLYIANGLLYNPITSEFLAIPLNGMTWKENEGICLGSPETLSESVLRNTCIDYSPGKSNGTPGTDDAESFYRFTAPVDGVITGCSLFLYTYFTAAQSTLNMMIDFIVEKRGANGEFAVTYRKPYQITRTGTEEKRDEIPLSHMGFSIEKDAEYRLKIQIAPNVASTTLVPGRFGFVVDYYSSVNPTQGYADHSKFIVSTSAEANGAHFRYFNIEGDATHSLVMIHYRKASDASSVTPTLGGQAMELLHLVQRMDSIGRDYWEAWYTCTGTFSGPTELRFTLHAGCGDEVRLMRYAAEML